MKKFLGIALVSLFCCLLFSANAAHAQATGNIVISGVDIGYAVGDHFTKDGQSCYNTYWAPIEGKQRCHKHDVCELARDPHCNCMRYWPCYEKCQIDLQGSQCLGFARFCEWKVYGSIETGSSTSQFHRISDAAQNVTASSMKALLLGCAPATHVRLARTDGHSISIVSTDENGLYFVDCNSDGFCKIVDHYYSWESFAGYVNSSSGITYVMSSVSYTPAPAALSLSIDLGEDQHIRGSEFPITGAVANGGTYPTLHLYVDYDWVADTANNSNGNYAFYLDTTKYSNGEHLIGVKITNDDGIDYTSWRKVVIDNIAPTITSVYITQKTDASYRVCCEASDNFGIKEVLVYTWTQDQSDMKCLTCHYNGAGTYFADISRSDFSSGANVYANHVYVHDNAGNQAVQSIDLEYENAFFPINKVYLRPLTNPAFKRECRVCQWSEETFRFPAFILIKLIPCPS